jgi:hypothetical protein
VWARAQEAAARDWGPAGAIHDLGTAQAIFARCYPTILAAWQARRELLELEILDLEDALQQEGVRLVYQPCPAQLSRAPAKASDAHNPFADDGGAAGARPRDRHRLA